LDWCSERIGRDLEEPTAMKVGFVPNMGDRLRIHRL
jgi:hypothetical protein